MSNAEVVAPVTDQFIVIKGNPAANQFVQHAITFKDLTFQHAQWLMPPGSFEPAQAAATIDAVVMADGANIPSRIARSATSELTRSVPAWLSR